MTDSRKLRKNHFSSHIIAGLSDGQLSFSDLGGERALQKAETDFRYFQDFIESEELVGKSDFTKGEAYESAREAKALWDELRQARSDLFKVQLDVENLDDVYQKISTALGPEAAQKFGQEIADPLTAHFATITQQTSAAASQAESDAQSAIDQAKRELEDLQRNQERKEGQARTLTDMSFDQRTELDQKISNVTDRSSGLNALDAIQSSGIIIADEALEVRRAVMRAFGQELNPESYAICKGDMLIKGQDVSRIKLGNTLSDDQLYGHKFDYSQKRRPATR